MPHAVSTERLIVGDGEQARRIALMRRAGDAPGLFFLGGYRSDMGGTKAQALDSLGARLGRMVTRFDYSGHGASDGALAEGTISRWLEEARAVFATTEGPQIVIGSSMGGWLALLLNRALREAGESRVRALILIAPAVDMTESLMAAGLSEAERETLARTGLVERASPYSEEPDPITARLLEDGRRHLMFGNTIRTGCPVHILQGGADREVPPEHARRLVAHILLDPVSLTLVPEGDHRLSRPEDLALLERTVERALAD